jgi:predicted Zn-dependent protease
MKLRQVILVVVAPVVASLVALACVTVPESNRRALNFLPDGQMNSLGEQAFKDVLAKEKISNDPYLNEMVTRIGRRIADASGVKFKWEFKVIDNAKTVNAFCLPGGKVAVYTGILSVAQNEGALAAIMGHEVAHATAKHGAERMSQAVTMQVGMLAADVALRDSKSRLPILAALGLGAQFGALLPYSRIHETEADKIGLVYMAKAGYDPKEAPELWVRMGQKGGPAPPEFMSTHPNPATRTKALREEVKKVMPLWESSQKQPSTMIKI